MYYYIRKGQRILSKDLLNLFKRVNSSSSDSNEEFTLEQEYDFLSDDKVIFIQLLKIHSIYVKDILEKNFNLIKSYEKLLRQNEALFTEIKEFLTNEIKEEPLSWNKHYSNYIIEYKKIFLK